MKDTAKSLCFHLWSPSSDPNLKARDGPSTNFLSISQELNGAYLLAPARLLVLQRTKSSLRQIVFSPKAQHSHPAP